MATCRCAPSLVRLDREFTVLYPGRDDASDGCCASAEHSTQNPKSDHEPARSGPAKGFARALDLDEDLTPFAPGPDDLMFFVLYVMAHPERFPQIKYMIYEGFIWYPHDGARPAGRYKYTGSNLHKIHLHISIFDNYAHWEGTWLPEDMFGDDPMTEEDRRIMREIHAALTNPDDPNSIQKAVREIRSFFDSDGMMGEVRRNLRRVAGALKLKGNTNTTPVE